MKLSYEQEYIVTREVLSGLREGDVVVVEGGSEGVVYAVDADRGELLINYRNGYTRWGPGAIEGLQITLKANHSRIWKPGLVWEFKP